MSNTTLTASLNVTPNFIVIPGSSNSGVVTRLNPFNRYEIEVDQVDGRLVFEEGITVKNGLGNIIPIRLVELIDINTSNLEDRAVLQYNANTEFFDFKLLDLFTNLTVSNTITVNSVSANGSLGSNGQVMYSNGSTVYWGDQFEFPLEIDGGFY